MHETDIQLISRQPIGHGECIERVINRDGVPYTAILKYGYEVASCPTAEEYRMIRWWNEEGHKLWKGKSRISSAKTKNQEPGTAT